MVNPSLLERQADEVSIKADIRKAIDANQGVLTPATVAHIVRLSPEGLREIRAYLNTEYPADRFPRAADLNFPYLMQIAQERMKAASGRLQPSGPGTYR